MTLKEAMEKLLIENGDNDPRYTDGVMDMYNAAKESDECLKK